MLEWFRERVHEASGGSDQTLIHQALRDYVQREPEPLEATLRRVLEEVLPATRATRGRKPRSGARRKPDARTKSPRARGRRKK